MDKKRGLNKRGAGEFKGMLWLVFLVGIILFGIALFSYFYTGQFGLQTVLRITELGITEISLETESFTVIFGDARLIVFDYVFGQVPIYQIQLTNEISGAIIVIGIWFLLFLTFADIIIMFGSFTKPVSWIIALILAIIAANIKFIVWIAAVGLVITAGFGAFAVVLDLLLIFFVFLGFNYGSSVFQRWVVKRKVHTLELRTAMGSAKVVHALKALKEIDETLFRKE